jgi:hypothetical protein
LRAHAGLQVLKVRSSLSSDVKACLAACALTCLCLPAIAQDRPENVRGLGIINGTLPADSRLIKVQKGDRLRWRITSNTSGELHLHAYRISVRLKPGQPGELAFNAFATGKFRVEWHPDVQPPAGGHAVAPLAVLEVQPN